MGTPPTFLEVSNEGFYCSPVIGSRADFGRARPRRVGECAGAQFSGPGRHGTATAADPCRDSSGAYGASAAATKDAQAFTGRIVKENGKVVLKDPVTKTSYQIDDVSKAKQFMGKQVKVTGKLDMNTNTIRVDTIEPMS